MPATSSGTTEPAAMTEPATSAVIRPASVPSTGVSATASAPPANVPIGMPAVPKARATATMRPCSSGWTSVCRNVTLFTFHTGVMKPEMPAAIARTSVGSPSMPSGVNDHAAPSMNVATARLRPIPRLALMVPAMLAPTMPMTPPAARINPAADGVSPNAR